jgi:hypothetical protein
MSRRPGRTPVRVSPAFTLARYAAYLAAELDKAREENEKAKRMLFDADNHASCLRAELAELRERGGCTTEDCAVCGQSVCTLEDCPRHPDGSELRDGRWVCCSDCWDEAATECAALPTPPAVEADERSE